jgi:hypothetical protein
MDPDTRAVVREELLRSIAWAALGLVGWPIAVSEFAQLDATALTVFGLPILTWMLLTGGMIAIRLRTGADLQVRSRVGIVVSLVVGLALAGLGGVYLVTVLDYSALWVGSAYLAVTLGTGLWYWFVTPSTDDPGPAA